MALGDLDQVVLVGEDPERVGGDGVVDHVGDRSGLQGVGGHPFEERLPAQLLFIVERIAGCVLEGLWAVANRREDVGGDESRTEAGHAHL